MVDKVARYVMIALGISTVMMDLHFGWKQTETTRLIRSFTTLMTAGQIGSSDQNTKVTTMV